MGELINGSRVIIFPQSGHMTFVDQPDLFVRTVDEFLAGK
jgi:pimeloyl-ACP methyl ester carboxylesterase